MAKITLDSVVSGFKSVSRLISNFNLLESALNDKVLWRDNPEGEPNQMLNELDMNSQRIINLPSAETATEPVTLGQFDAAQSGILFAATSVETQVAAAAQTVFNLAALSYSPGINNMAVYINGVYQSPSTYTENDTNTVTMSEPLQLNDVVDFAVNVRPISLETVLAANVAYTAVGGGNTNVQTRLNAYESGDGSDLIIFTQEGTGAEDRSVQNKLRETKSATDFGATGDGATDDTAALQAAVDSFGADGGILYVPAGTYMITDTVWVSKPVLIVGDGEGDVSTNNNSTGLMTTTFRWDGANGGLMFLYSAVDSTDLAGGSTDGNIIYGGGMTRAAVYGKKDSSTVAATGIWAASTSRALFTELQISRCSSYGLLVDGGNAALSVRNVFSVNFVAGADAITVAMDGLVFRAFNSNVSTQNHCTSVSGLLADGDLVVCGDTDNNVFNHVQGVHTGTGNAIRFKNGIANHARNNLVMYANGNIKAESSTRGNRILHLISEATSVSIDAGGQMHYEVVDYVNEELFQTHSYTMSDELTIPAGGLTPDGTTAVSGVHAAQWDAIIFPDGSTGIAYSGAHIPHKWNDGSITGVVLTFSTDTANSSDAARMNVRLSAYAEGEATATPQVDESFTVSVNDTANRLNKQTLTFAAPVTYTNAEALVFNLRRLGADAADTMSGDVELLGVTVLYTGTGPNSAGSGPFDVPPTGV